MWGLTLIFAICCFWLWVYFRGCDKGLFLFLVVFAPGLFLLGIYALYVCSFIFLVSFFHSRYLFCRWVFLFSSFFFPFFVWVMIFGLVLAFISSFFLLFSFSFARRTFAFFCLPIDILIE
jgi:hypothetical protein